MHPVETHTQVAALVAEGINDCEIARRVGLSRTTVRDMRRPRQQARTTDRVECPRCGLPARPLLFAPERYTYLLGLYLGDGCIAQLARTYSLRLSLDAKYPGIVAEARAALTSCSPTGRVSQHLAGPRRTTTVLCVYGTHLPCLFPQHGPGKKHTRRIEFEPWQADLVSQAPWPLIRGLIQSDGCRFLNRTGRYVYPSYDFTQLSDDIRGIFADACDLVGVEYRAYARRVRIYRRPSVELMDVHVGTKY